MTLGLHRSELWGRRGIVTVHFNCPNCDALYQVVRAEAGPETIDGELACLVCDGPLAARDGEFVLKYFLLRKPRRRQVKSAPSRLVSVSVSDAAPLRPDHADAQ